MRVLVTGGSGSIGQWVVREFVEHGHEVYNADLKWPDMQEEAYTSGKARYFDIELGDVGQVAGVLSTCDALVHLGAIPRPGRYADEVVFTNNTRATFAVLQAASLLNIRKAVVASSISALGMAWAIYPFLPLYTPADEAHPLLGQDPYALSKEVGERTCEMFHRRTGMQVLAYRFPWVAQPGQAAARTREVQQDPGSWAHQLWGYINVRDAAIACRLGLEADGFGFEVFNIIASDSMSEIPTEELIKRYSSEVELRAPIPGTATGWSVDKARNLLGFESQHSWRDA